MQRRPAMERGRCVARPAERAVAHGLSPSARRGVFRVLQTPLFASDRNRSFERREFDNVIGRVDDADAVVARAFKAGAQVVMPVADMFWGDRNGKIVDRFGHHRPVAMHIKDLTPEDIQAAE